MVPGGVHAWTDFEMRNVHSITDGLNMDTIKIKKIIYPSRAQHLLLIEIELIFALF